MFFIVSVKKRGKFVLSPTAVRFHDEEASFLDMYNHTMQICDIPKYHIDDVYKITIKSQSSCPNEVGISSVTLPLSLCKELQHKFVQYTLVSF